MAGRAHRLRPASKGPRFFQLIMPGMVQDQQLAVPKLFAKEYGDGLSSRVVFKLPNGAEWPIRLSGSGGKLWFSQGWRQFADFHFVNSMGYFLMFEYLGNSLFRVFIFDPSASEFSYPPFNIHEDDVSVEAGGEEDDHSVETLDSCPPSPETWQEPPLSNRSRHPKLKKGLARGLHSCPAGKFNRVIGRLKPLSGRGSSVGGNGGVCRRTLSAGLPRKRVLRTNMQSSKLKANGGRQSTIFGSSSETAVPFTSGNPSFEVTVATGHLPHHGSRSCKVRMPTGFASTVEKDVCEAELWVEGSYWRVNLIREVQKGNDYISLGGGWRQFAVENSVKVGDVCVFKLIGTKAHGFSQSMRFKVHISRGE